MQSELRMTSRAGEEGPLSGRKIVEADYGVTRGKKPVDHIAGDESSRTRHENAQEKPPVMQERI
jgi:hypothetical protein